MEANFVTSIATRLIYSLNLRNLRPTSSILILLQTRRKVRLSIFNHKSIRATPPLWLASTNGQLMGSKGTIPLCHPNNFRFYKKKNELLPISDQSRETLKLNPEALDIIGKIEEAIAVVCICGPARSGKSYILSQLQDGVEFELGHEMISHTTGIWMAREPMIYQTTDGYPVRLILLDTEGIGAAAARDGQANEYCDNQIFTLSTLISSVLIYNSQGVPNTTDLEKLNFVTKLSEGIHGHFQQGNDNVEELANFRNYFPDFIWLIRDLLLQPTDKNGKECDIKTYLKHNVLNPEDSTDGSDVREKRNAIRRNIRDIFPTFRVHGIPIPSVDPKVVQNLANPIYKWEINPMFLRKVDVAKKKILKIIKPKRIVGAAFVTGPVFVELLKGYVQVLNEKGSVPQWASAWDNAITATCDRALESATNLYRARIGKVYDELPCANDRIFSVHVAALKSATELFTKETRMATDVKVITEYTIRLMNVCAEFDEATHKCIGGILRELLSKNEHLSEMFCTNLYDGLQKEFLDPLLSNITPTTSFETLLESIAKMKSKYEVEAVGPCTNAVQERFATALTERLKQVAKDISRMKDYDEKLHEEIQENIRKDAELERIAEQTQILNDHLKSKEAQHAEQISIMKEQHDTAKKETERIRQAHEEERKKLQSMMSEMHDEHRNAVNKLYEVQRIQQERHRQADSSFHARIGEMQGQNAALQESIRNLKNQLNNPPARTRRERGCVIQ